MSRQRKSIKFFIATDVHLGHKENHPVRKNDSFNAFEEVLAISTEENADFLLLGGDLFDEVNPSQKTIYKCLDILQHYVQGETSKNLNAHWQDHPEYRINFSNQNISIKLPIFTIHGNHDYPSNDFGKISICDLLHVSNYANYFGKHTNLSEIVIKPMIIQKEGMQMKIAVYGLGYIKDNVLNELFDKNKVKFQTIENREEYFCLFIFHQNRYKKGLRAGAPALKCISSKHIPSWMDLTIWGHEHEAISKIDVEDDRKIFQPGSTVITSFIEAESYLKQCLKIEIFEDGEIDINPTPLIKSYRPMICRNYEIEELAYDHKKNNGKEFDLYSFLDNELSAIIDHIDKEFPKKKPLIRMKIEYTGFEISRCKMLELKYTEKVANADSILTFWKRKEEKLKDDKELFQAFKDKTDLNFEQKEITEEILIKYIQSQQNKNLYFDPRELYTHHHNSILKDTNYPKDYLNQYFTKEIEKKCRPVMKEVEDVYKTSLKETDVIVRGKFDEVMGAISLDVDDGGGDSGDGENGKDKKEEHVTNKRTILSLWEEQKRQLLMKENEINSTSLLTNYGDNFIDINSIKNNKDKKEEQHQRMSNNNESTKSTTKIKENERESYERRLTPPIPEEWKIFDSEKKITKYTTNSNSNKNSNKMEVEYEEPYYEEQKRESKQQNRQGILRNKSGNNNNNNNKKEYSDFESSQEEEEKKEHQHNKHHKHSHKHNININNNNSEEEEEEDCCKRAEKTEYDERKTKSNFNGAHNMVKNNGDKKIKKNVKQQQQKTIEESMMMEKKIEESMMMEKKNKKKSVKWSDSDLE